MTNVVLDANTSFDTGSGTSALIVISHPVAVKPNRLMVVKVAWADVLLNAASITSITYGTTTLFQHDIASTSTNSFNIDYWSSTGEDTGTNNCTITFTGAVTAVVSVESYYGVDQSTPLFGLSASAVATGLSGKAFAQLVAKTPHNLCTDIVVSEKMATANTITKQALQTQLMNRFPTYSSQYVLAGSSTRPGVNGNEQLSWTQSLTNVNWAIVVSELLSQPTDVSPVQLLMGR